MIILARNIFLLSLAVCAASAKHVHSMLHKKHMEVDQIPITYIATVAAGFPLSSSSDKHHLSSASRAVISQMPANSASGIYDAWCAGFLDTNQWIQVSFITPRTVVSIATQGRH